MLALVCAWFSTASGILFVSFPLATCAVFCHWVPNHLVGMAKKQNGLVKSKVEFATIITEKVEWLIKSALRCRTQPFSWQGRSQTLKRRRLPPGTKKVMKGCYTKKLVDILMVDYALSHRLSTSPPRAKKGVSFA